MKNVFNQLGIKKNSHEYNIMSSLSSLFPINLENKKQRKHKTRIYRINWIEWKGAIENHELNPGLDIQSPTLKSHEKLPIFVKAIPKGIFRSLLKSESQIIPCNPSFQNGKNSLL